MNKKLQPVRGTHDLLPEIYALHQHIAGVASDVAGRYGFAGMAVPIFEFSDVFHRTLGESSDVVSKETYSFEDRGGESLTLRPELTAGIARAFVSNGLQERVPFKAFYRGPAFRYERPQKGRQRQFHQIGVELIGASKVSADIDVIAAAYDVLDALGLAAKATLELNTLGDKQSRDNYRAALVEYFTAHKKALSEDSLRRLEANPLRILDSKDEGDRVLVANAPRLHAYLTEEAQTFWDDLRAGLDALGIAYTLNDRLVRGLDYYNHTVFEFTTDALGAQNTMLAGGRYDGLVEMMGGQPQPGVGWAAGVERLALMLEDMNAEPAAKTPFAVVIPMRDEQQTAAQKMAIDLRRAGHHVEMGYSGNSARRMKKANQMGASFALLLGEDEAANNTISVKNLATGEQETIAQSALVAYLTKE